MLVIPAILPVSIVLALILAVRQFGVSWKKIVIAFVACVELGICLLLAFIYVVGGPV